MDGTMVVQPADTSEKHGADTHAAALRLFDVATEGAARAHVRSRRLLSTSIQAKPTRRQGVTRAQGPDRAHKARQGTR